MIGQVGQAFMTGRLGVRTGMEVTKVIPPEGCGDVFCSLISYQRTTTIA